LDVEWRVADSVCLAEFAFLFATGPMMTTPARNVVVLGSTGSIGRSTLDVIEHSAGRLRVVGLSAHGSLPLLVEQTERFRPDLIAATDNQLASDFAWPKLPAGTELLRGPESLVRLASHPAADVVVAAVVGSAGLNGAWAALEAGKTLALANKETLVMAGPLVMDLARQRGSKILPVDSEHSAVYQALACGHPKEVRRIVLTASGGPFRRHTREQLSRVTVEDALAHPTWRMGKKITVDSATMMNKALEIIEARWLFDLKPEQIDVVVHPQSVVHSFVEFVDGSVLAQMSPPDMKLPIQFALTWPERWPSPSVKLDWSTAWKLEFEPPDEDRFPALRLGHEVARSGGTAGAVLNAANEAAVARFLAGTLRYHQIVPCCQAVLENHEFDPRPSLERLVKLDAWSREEVCKWNP
jgi:1-deoxy-D-xylulose-5-phosphate reductoisomerase